MIMNDDVLMDNTNPLVSIIMNCYNSDRYLKEAIDSIYSQTYSNWEIIFWDNASTDKSAKIANSYDKKLKYFLAEKTTQLGEARNLALKKAVGKYIAFLDCDDIYFSEKISRQVHNMEISNGVLSYGGAIVINESGREINRYIPKNKSGYVFSKLLKKYEINMQSVCILNDILKKHKLGFDETLKYCPDYNLFMKIATLGHVDVINDYVVKYRKHDNSLSSRTYHLIHKEMRYTLDALFADHRLLYNNKLSAEIAYKMLCFYEAIPYIDSGDFAQARLCLKKVASLKLKYFLLYLLFFLPIPPRFIVKKIVG